jgi:hypothetical protein
MTLPEIVFLLSEIQVGIISAQNVPTWKHHPRQTPFRGTSQIQVGTFSSDFVPTWTQKEEPGVGLLLSLFFRSY